jgi:hypothetical protein
LCIVFARWSIPVGKTRLGSTDATAVMSMEHLRRLVADAERQPRLRALLRLGDQERPWQRLIERARTLGYPIEWTDLEQACAAEAACRFLAQARIEPVADLLGSVTGRRAQLSSRRLASTSR